MEDCNHTPIKNREKDWSEIGKTIHCPICGEKFVIRHNGVSDKIYYVSVKALKEKR